jgi:hypothetical protein
MNYWFKTFRRGYGWYPASWQGWAVIIIYVLNVYFGVSLAGKIAPDKLQTLVLYLPVLFLTTIMMFVIVVKTGEKAKWK